MRDRKRTNRSVGAGRVCWLALGLALALAGPGASAAGTQNGEEKPAASATLPLEEILALYRARDAAEQEEEAPPPLAAALQKVELEGRLLADGIDFSAQFEVLVLEEDTWVSIPLLAYDAESHVSQLPTVADGAFAVSDGQLVFLTRKAGRYRFELSLFRSARAEGRARSLSLAHGSAALASCRLEIDAGLFRLTTQRVVEGRDGVHVLPQGDTFEIAWEVREEAVAARAEPSEAPALESVVPRLHVSTVSTLEGRRLTRLLYELRFAGRKPIEIELPEGHTLQHVFLNGVATAAEPEAGRLRLEVSPARAGDERGTLELVLAQPGGVFHLAGALHFDLPRVSWPTHELFLTLHLPPVFDYRWAGGSLEPRSGAPAASYSYRIPEPGRELHFHQMLIGASAPDLDIDYEVNLQGNYFRDTRAGG